MPLVHLPDWQWFARVPGGYQFQPALEAFHIQSLCSTTELWSLLCLFLISHRIDFYEKMPMEELQRFLNLWWDFLAKTQPNYTCARNLERQRPAIVMHHVVVCSR